MAGCLEISGPGPGPWLPSAFQPAGMPSGESTVTSSGIQAWTWRRCYKRQRSFLGEHDFRNFSSAKVDTVKTVQKLEISEQNGLFVFDIRANGFLWNMVRKIVGALEKVGAGQKDMDWFSDLLRPELNHGAPTAPAEGLILMDVGYEGLDWQVDEYSRAAGVYESGGDGAKRMAKAQVARVMEKAMGARVYF